MAFLFAAGLIQIRRLAHPFRIDLIGPQDRLELSKVPVGDKRDRLALTAHAGGPAGPMRIALGTVRQVVIKNMCRMRKIQPAGGDIRRYKILNIQPFDTN